MSATDEGLQRTPLEGPHGPFVGTPSRRLDAFATEPRLEAILQSLYAAYGPQYWWPAETPFEIVVGAVLTQNTAWRNVERALERLREASCLAPEPIAAAETGDLEEWIRPSGTYRAKARKLVEVSRWYLAVGGLRPLRERPLGPLRGELLGVHGIGPETADCILCYAAGRRTPVVDAYTRRILARHDLVPADTPYEAVREWLRGALVDDPLVYEEFHALAVRAGTYCKPTPDCESCPAPPPPGPGR